MRLLRRSLREQEGRSGVVVRVQFSTGLEARGSEARARRENLTQHHGITL